MGKTRDRLLAADKERQQQMDNMRAARAKQNPKKAAAEKPLTKEEVTS